MKGGFSPEAKNSKQRQAEKAPFKYIKHRG